MFRALRRIFDYAGRSTRWEYWSFSLGFALLLLLIGAWAANYQQTHLGLPPQPSDDEAAGIGLAVFIFLVLPALALRVRRYHDFGWSGWAVLWVFVPIVNLVMELMLLFRGPVPEPVAYAAPAEQGNVTIYNSTGAGPVEASGMNSAPAEQIARLADLHAQGALTAQEFAAAKARVLRP